MLKKSCLVRKIKGGKKMKKTEIEKDFKLGEKL